MRAMLSNVKKPAFQAHTEWASEAPTKIWMLRHGETDWNIQRRIQGWKGTGLNAMGFAQAKAAALRLKGVKFDLILSSDLKRCLQTAHAVADPRKMAVHTLPEARERCFGEWEGKTIGHILKTAKLSAEHRRDPFLGITPKGGETMPVFMARMKRMLTVIEQRFAGKSILLVTHGGPVRLAAAAVLGVPWKKYHLLGRPGNTSVSLFMSQGGTRWLEFYNDQNHLHKNKGR